MKEDTNPLINCLLWLGYGAERAMNKALPYVITLGMAYFAIRSVFQI